jgi:hypothetical protein
MFVTFCFPMAWNKMMISTCREKGIRDACRFHRRPNSMHTHNGSSVQNGGDHRREAGVFARIHGSRRAPMEGSERVAEKRLP